MIYRAALLLAMAGACLAAGPDGYEYQSIGDNIMRSYTSYVQVPITEKDATAAGWFTNDAQCDPVYGFMWQMKGGVGEHTPLVLFMNAAGQVSGTGMVMYQDAQPTSLQDAGFMLPYDSSNSIMTVMFRNSSYMCSQEPTPLPLGDQLVINPTSTRFSSDPSKAANFFVPLNTAAAERDGFVKGACFKTMGTHYSLALSDPGKMNWRAADLLPLVPMYNAAGNINAYFYASTIRQQTILPPSTNTWDGIALPYFLMCKNWCDSSWDIDFWSTDHHFLGTMAQLDDVTCPGGCTIACCP